MAKIRSHLSFPAYQWERLVARNRQETLPKAELVRRAVDAYLA